MSEFAIEVEGGSSVRLPTAGKYCDRDIVVTATGGGQELFYGDNGQPHAEHLEIPTPTAGTAFNLCHELKSINWLNATVAGKYSGGFDCKKLESVKFPKVTAYTESYIIRQQNVTAPYTLREVVCGSIGHPVSKITNWRWLYGAIADDMTLTIYVDADTLEDISADVTTNALGNTTNKFPTLIYRNSTTGEVITG